MWLAQQNYDADYQKHTLHQLGVIFSHCPHLTKKEIDRFLIEKRLEGWKNSSLNTMMVALRVFNKYKKVPYIPRLFKTDPVLKATMSDSEIEEFLTLQPTEHRNTEIAKFHRYTMLFEIMAMTGMRGKEVSCLTVEACDFGRDLFVLEKTKIKEPRLVPIPPNIKEKLRAYIGSLHTDLLFPKDDGVTPTDKTDRHHHFQKRIKRMGIKRKNLSCHSLRHSFITSMLSENVNLFTVMKIVGHRKAETTQQYSHLSYKDTQKAIVKLPLVRKHTDGKSMLRAIVDAIRSLALEENERIHFAVEETPTSIKIEVSIK